ncbi:MAG: histidine kinase dimerization/phospho-acceptor domain-containing protein, partial [Sedimenticola sp.]|nr:histidine kinase dimerization/phospho-acceptor domain-containing protein [Sedimenticola sp.]
MVTDHKAKPAGGLMASLSTDEQIMTASGSEEAWIEVIQKMDSVYADLVRYQVELEEKNSALEEAQRFIESVQTAMTDVLIVCDIRGRIQQANKALETITGRSEKELLNRSFKELFGESSQYLIEGFADKIRSETVYDCEVNLIREDGKLTPLAMNCSTRFDHNGRLVGMVLIGRPVGELRRAYEELHATHRELKQAQEQLVHSEKMASLGRLVAGVAHELNNPISFVFGNMHALKRYGSRITQYLDAIHKGTAEEEREALRKQLKIDHILSDIGSLIDGTLEGAERVSDIVLDLRRFSGNQQEDTQPFQLAPVVATAVDWVVKAARRKPEVTVDIPEELEAVGIKGLVHQILVNLVQNAIDVMDEEDAPRLQIRG